MLKKWLSRSRFLIIFAVFGCLLLATLLFLYGAFHSVGLVFEVLENQIGGKKLVIGAIELVDYFLLATVFYITSIGLYELFIDDSIEVPAWLEIHTLDDLKVKLLGVVVTVLGVLFLGQIVTWDGQRELLGYGVSIAAVIGAITFYTRKK
ncbi:MAG TPA: YqhA family protein [Abditibacterium sp.]|jgi:uncharacterized membrane protein YqhA